MKTTLLSLVFILLTTPLGCDKKEEAPPSPEPMQKPETAADDNQADEAKQAEPEETGPSEEVKKQCNELLDKSFGAVKPALTMLKVDLAQVESKYKEAMQGLVETCLGLEEKERTCLAGAKNPIVGILTCKIKQEDGQPFEPASISEYANLFASKKLPAKVAKKMLASMRGRWTNQVKQTKTKTVWNIKKNGDVAQTKIVEGKKQNSKLQIAFEDKDQLLVKEGNESTAYVFLRGGKKVFFAGEEADHGLFPMTKKDSFNLADNDVVIFFNKGKCKAVHPFGLVTEAKCKWGKVKGKKNLKVEYKFETESKAKSHTYFVAGKYLLDESLFHNGRFMKK